MIIDYSQTTIDNGIVSFPDWAYETQPKTPLPEFNIVTGASANASYVRGTIGEPTLPSNE